MFYVSKVLNKDKIGVVDTDDGIEEFFDNKSLVKIIKEKGIEIYGAYCYNNIAECEPLVINQTLDVAKLRSLLDNWKNIHNQWSGYPVENYLASAKVGTVIVVDYKYYGDGTKRWHDSTTYLKKLGIDKWHYKDVENSFDGKEGDSRFAAWALEVSCIYSTLKRITIS